MLFYFITTLFQSNKSFKCFKQDGNNSINFKNEKQELKKESQNPIDIVAESTQKLLEIPSEEYLPYINQPVNYFNIPKYKNN